MKLSTIDRTELKEILEKFFEHIAWIYELKNAPMGLYQDWESSQRYNDEQAAYGEIWSLSEGLTGVGIKSMVYDKKTHWVELYTDMGHILVGKYQIDSERAWLELKQLTQVYA